MDSIVILTILSLPIQERNKSFLLFVSSSVSFDSVSEFSKYKSFAFIGRFIPKHFTLFDAVVNGIVPLISHSDNSLLVCINGIFFYMLNLLN